MKVKAVAVNGLIALCSTLAALGLGELALRLQHPQNLSLYYKTRDDLHVHRANYVGVWRGVETTQGYRTNSFGMRDREHEAQKREGTFRILLLGDSQMEALQVPFDRSFPKLLEQKLNQPHIRTIEVVSVAVAGWGQSDELAYLERYAARLSPDLILVGMTLHNDISDNMKGEFYTLTDTGLVANPVREIPLLEYKIWQLRAFLAAHSHVYQLVRDGWRSAAMSRQGNDLSAHVVNLIRATPSEPIERGWKLTYELLRRIRAKGREIGADTAVFLIPLSIQLEEEKLFGLLARHKVPPIAVSVRRPQELMTAFGAAEQMSVIDLLPDFVAWKTRHEGLLFLKYDGHLTERGHELAAAAVARELLERRLIRG